MNCFVDAAVDAEISLPIANDAEAFHSLWTQHRHLGDAADRRTQGLDVAGQHRKHLRNHETEHTSSVHPEAAGLAGAFDTSAAGSASSCPSIVPSRKSSSIPK